MSRRDEVSLPSIFLELLCKLAWMTKLSICNGIAHTCNHPISQKIHWQTKISPFSTGVIVSSRRYIERSEPLGSSGRCFQDSLFHGVFEMNPYDWCVENKTINRKQCTVRWHVDDLMTSHKDERAVTKVIEHSENVFGKEDPFLPSHLREVVRRR
jgi:hypothetical protein